MSNLKFHIKHQTKMALASVLRFVVARPKLLAVGKFVGGRIKPLKRFLTHVHVSSAPAISPEWLPAVVPPPARAVFLQLTAGKPEN